MVHELCDRCGFRAYVGVMNEKNETLSFCKHHFEQHEVALGMGGWLVVLDERALLTALPQKEEVKA